MKRKKNVHVLTDLLVNTYPLLEGELIPRITFEPQGVDDPAIQPSQQYHGRSYNG